MVFFAFTQVSWSCRAPFFHLLLSFCLVFSVCPAERAIAQGNPSETLGQNDNNSDAVGDSEHSQGLPGGDRKKPKDQKIRDRSGGGRDASMPGIWFPPWPVSDLDWFINPIIGLSYDTRQTRSRLADSNGVEREVLQTQRLLFIEGGARTGLMHIPLAGHKANSDDGAFAITVSPRLGYAYGQINELENSLQIEGEPKSEFAALKRPYQRVLVGADLTSYVSWFRYTLGLDFARLLGKSADGFPMTQGQVSHDFGIKILRRVSGHLTLKVGRIARSDLSDFSLQYTDIWLHLRFSPFHKLVLDAGPGMDFQFLPEPNTGVTASYAKILFDWPLFGSFGAAGDVKYILDSDRTTLLGDAASREPLGDLGAGAQVSAENGDHLDALVFLGLRNVLPGWSVGYIIQSDVENTFERKGSREVNTSQGLGVHVSVGI